MQRVFFPYGVGLYPFTVKAQDWDDRQLPLHLWPQLLPLVFTAHHQWFHSQQMLRSRDLHSRGQLRLTLHRLDLFLRRRQRRLGVRGVHGIGQLLDGRQPFPLCLVKPPHEHPPERQPQNCRQDSG